MAPELQQQRRDLNNAMNAHRLSFIYSIGIFFLMIGLPFSVVQAACPLPATTSTSLGANTCTIAAGTITYVDVGSGSSNTGVLTLDNSSGSITIESASSGLGGDLRVGSISIPAGGGSISLQPGTVKGTIHTNAPTYMTDNDGDGYPESTTTSTAGGAGLSRVGLLTSTITLDCNDGSASVWISHAACYPDMDKDTYTIAADSNTTCLNSASCNTATAASTSTNGAAVTAYTAGQLQDSANLNSLGAVDCDDTDPTKWVIGVYGCGQ